MEISPRQVCEDIFSLMEHFKKGVHQIGEEYKLTPPQISTLYAISRGYITMGSVASRLHCDASNVTGIIDRLVLQELVERRENEQDRRAKTLQLTAQGDRIVQEMLEHLPKKLGCTLLTADERAVFHNMFIKMIQTV